MDEKLYLVCDDCGEAFDTLETANAHGNNGGQLSFRVVPESEAF